MPAMPSMPPMMVPEYKVVAFLPAVAGCGASDKGWDRDRCSQFENFLNQHTAGGWRLHSSEYRTVTASTGCGSTQAAWLVCIFERIRS